MRYFVIGVMVGAIVVLAGLDGLVSAQVSAEPAVEALPVTWERVYQVDRAGLPPDVVEAYVADPEGTIAAVIEAIDQAQGWLDETWAARGLEGAPLTLRAQVYAHIRSVKVVEAEHYLVERAGERGVTRENDARFFEAVAALKEF